jgi:hypothetical protein
MTVQFSTAVRNAQLDAIETAIGTAPKLRFYTGSAPASCAASESGTLLVEWTLASDWAAAASGGSKALNNLPLTVTATAGGTIGHYRIYDSAGTSCHEQGTITATGGGGDMTVDNTSVAASQTVNVTSKTQTAGNA